MNQRATPHSVRWDGKELQLLDQRQLPHRVEYLEIESVADAWHAIKTLAVRGAPAIGIAAAYALASAMRDVAQDEFLTTLSRHGDHLKTARPTAANLAWAVERLCARAAAEPSAAALRDEAQAIHQEDREICRQIGEHGACLVEPQARVLTHCNAGALAVSELGTATAPLYLRHRAGTPFHVYVDETRPLYQGARLTAFELANAGISVELICDNMAATLMAQGKVDLVLVGTDRVTGNGDVVNKIGTLNLAVLCHHFRVPFYVACPSSTYDPTTKTGADVVIEERAATEVLGEHAATVPAYNPAFDVTPASLVSGIITEHGIARPPLADQLAALMSEGPAAR